MPRASYLILFLFALASCSLQKRLGRTAGKIILKSETLKTAHIGISIFEPATNRYWYNYQGDHYFVPASNVKIPTCYAAMKYLGDSIVGLRYFETDTSLSIQPTADPTLLHRAFKKQPVYDFLKKLTKPLVHVRPPWQSYSFGSGWAWDDYNDAYQAERAALPIYGNVMAFRLLREEDQLRLKGDIPFFRRINNLVMPLHKNIRVIRRKDENLWDVLPARDTFDAVQIPFMTYENPRLLEDTLGLEWAAPTTVATGQPFRKLYSHPVDSVLLPMMHQSDNFMAEQCLLMASNELLGVMSDQKIIDTILKTDFASLPQKPRWVDGSGLSRYNLFTPQDFVAILAKMKTEFGMERLKRIFPANGQGTLRNYYSGDTAYLFAKTGTLSGVVALSGFLYTRKGKLLLISVLVNNHRAQATEVRHSIETFLQEVRRRN